MSSVNLDSESVQRWLITLGLILFAAFVSFKAAVSGSMFMIALVVALPLMIYFINNPRALLIGVFFAHAANLTVPGMPHNLTLTQVGIAGVVLLGVAHTIIEKSSAKKKELSDRILVAAMLVVILTMMVRGSGIRALGGTQWGGMEYVTLLLGGTFYLVAPMFRFSPKNVRTLVILILIASFLPAVAQILFKVTGGRFYHLYYIMNYADIQYVADSLRVTSDPRYVTRLTALSGISMALLPAVFVFHYRGMGRLIQAGLLIAAAVLAVLSGGRGAILNIICISSIIGFLLLKGDARRKFVARIMIVGLVGYIGLFFFADRLPVTAQRALSWVPFIHISPIAASDATGSTSWRLEVWKLAWAELPKYLVIGKGFCFDPAFVDSMSLRWDTVQSAFLVHNYHSGPLTLLLDLGIMGIVTWTAFILRTAYEEIRAIPRIAAVGLERRFFYYLIASFTWSIVSFFVIFGGLSSILFFLLRASLMRILRYGIEEQNEAMVAPKAPAPVIPTIRKISAHASPV